MPFAITQNCCNDASCVSVCPVNCIHPTPEEPDFGSTDMLYIDPEACINCGACADACPVDAIFPVEALRGGAEVYSDVNRRYYEDHPTDHSWGEPEFPLSVPLPTEPLRVAVVGTGPAASYAARNLLHSTDADITILDRLPVTGGLLRAGVAPDHPATKRIGDGFAEIYRHPRVSLALNVEVGRDITHEELAAHHSAVLYGVGASADRSLDVPGEDLPGSLSATQFVNWYNAHPDFADLEVDLSGERAVVVGTGNVAMDVARILLADPDELARTDIADHALAALRASTIREVVLLGRRGPEHAAFTLPEFLALRDTDGLQLVVADGPDVRAGLSEPRPGSKAELLAELPRETVDWSAPVPTGKRLVFSFCSPVAAIHGADHVESLQVCGTEPGNAVIPTRLVLRAVGYRGRPVAGLPFDQTTGTVPNESGRVISPDTGTPVPGAYVAGWIKRGPSGGIGANRRCAEQTVGALLDDVAAGRVQAPQRSYREFQRLLRRRQPNAVDQQGLLAIDAAERAAGRAQGRPRVKLATVDELLRAARGTTKRGDLSRLRSSAARTLGQTLRRSRRQQAGSR